MAKEFKYQRNKRTRTLTTIWIVVMAGIVLIALTLLDGTYIHAWLLSILAAILALYIMSIPRRISVDEDNIEIHCVVELTRIDVRDVRSIRKVESKDVKGLFPVFGCYGFFGYYGYYLSLRKWEIVKVYASEWDNLVEINDIYEETYLVSCGQADELIESVLQVKLLRTGERAAK